MEQTLLTKGGDYDEQVWRQRQIVLLLKFTIMIEKIKKLIGSIRFWIALLGAVAAYLALVEVNGFVLSDLFNVITGFLAAVVAIGTIDKFSSLKE